MASRTAKRNLTISLDPEIIHKARIIAARRSTSIGRLVAEQMEILVRREESYGRAKRRALTLLDKGFHLGGVICGKRAELHDR